MVVVTSPDPVTWHYGYATECPATGPGKLRCAWVGCEKPLLGGGVVVGFAGAHDRVSAVFHELCWQAYRQQSHGGKVSGE